jgi:hypothetical protein
MEFRVNQRLKQINVQEGIMSEFTNLLNEYKQLKDEVFDGEMFVVLDQDDNKVQRYNQLLGFFYPQFRTSDWKSPV